MIKFFRQKDLPQPAAMAHSYRTAPPAPKFTYHLRPQPYRRSTRTDSATLPTGHGPELRWFNCRIALQSRKSMERCFATGTPRCARLYTEHTCHPRHSTENLSALCRQIDDLDNSLLELMARRMRVSEEIGQYKKNTICPFCNRNATMRFFRTASSKPSAWTWMANL